MIDYWLMPLVGFLMDTTLAAASLVFSGVAERFPNIRWVLGHLGGAIPYLAERLDRGYEAFAECRANIDRPPTTYLKKFYYDTVNFDPRALGWPSISPAPTRSSPAATTRTRSAASLKMQESLHAMRISKTTARKSWAGTRKGCWEFRGDACPRSASPLVAKQGIASGYPRSACCLPRAWDEKH